MSLYKGTCVRCNSEFDRNPHPLSHFSSICYECMRESPETIYEQQKYNMNLHLNIWEIK